MKGENDYWKIAFLALACSVVSFLLGIYVRGKLT